VLGINSKSLKRNALLFGKKDPVFFQRRRNPKHRPIIVELFVVVGGTSMGFEIGCVLRLYWVAIYTHHSNPNHLKQTHPNCFNNF